VAPAPAATPDAIPPSTPTPLSASIGLEGVLTLSVAAATDDGTAIA
jgi:hypothetical protein